MHPITCKTTTKQHTDLSKGLKLWHIYDIFIKTQVWFSPVSYMLNYSFLFSIFARVLSRSQTRHLLYKPDGFLISSVASQTIQSRYANLKVLSLFISVEIDCFHSQ